MKKTLITLAIIATTIAKAEARQCVIALPGWMYINHDSRWAWGNGFAASLSCTRGTPNYLYYRGGAVCRNRYFYGRTIWNRPWSCRINAVWWR